MQRVRSKSPDTESEVPLDQQQHSPVIRPGFRGFRPLRATIFPRQPISLEARPYGGSAELCGVELNGDDPAKDTFS